MLRILVANSKGGSGKTTLATNLADYYANAGFQTALLDTDRQESSLHWHQLRSDTQAQIRAVQYYGAAAGTSWDNDWGIPASTQRLIIDSPAGLRGYPLGDLLRRVKVLLVPVLPSDRDLDTTIQFLKEVRRRSEIRDSDVRVGLVANRMRNQTRSTRSLRDRLAEYDYPCVAELRDTQLYVFADGLGKGVHDLRSQRARMVQAEWEPLIRWIEGDSGAPARPVGPVEGL
jgi:chromosome partitioning protein